jgi:XTP/dITP diphosphohydrolase
LILKGKSDYMKLIAATGNTHKLNEFRRILEPLGIEVVAPADVGAALDVEETGSTFAENAAIKARALHDIAGLGAFADDSGLCVDALDGRPGVYSARYGGEDTPHSEKITLLLEELRGVSDDHRGAQFVCAIHCVLADGTELSCQGVFEGRIGHGPRGENGFGYDPIFMVGDRSSGEMSSEEKDALSHRGKALREFVRLLSASPEGVGR